MTDFVIEFPDYFEDEASIIETKGVFSDFTVVVGDRQLRPTVFDPVRFAQECHGSLASADGFYAVGALIVVPSVTRRNIEDAIQKLSRGNFGDLLDALGEQ